MDNFNIDDNTMNNIKNLINSGDLSSAMSQIPSDVIENFSKMMKNNTNKKDKDGKNNDFNAVKHSNVDNDTVSSNFNLNNIDINTISKISSTISQINNSKNDPRANLLNSLKPYLRDSKKDKIDSYINMLNIAKIAEIINNNKEKNND